jgi:ADP-dependent NAD(P)H-hydrate dehydratase
VVTDARSAAPLAIEPELLRSWPIPLDADDDKNGRGTVLVIGGSARTPGAVELAGVAALRSGAGKLQLATVTSVAAALSIAVPEALVESLPESADGAIEADQDLGRLEDRVRQADAILFGPGLEDLERSARLLRWVVERVGDAVLVIDALGLACFAALSANQRAGRCNRVVLTPNRVEAVHLVPELTESSADHERAVAVARAFGAVTTTHGHIASPDGRCWHDEAGDVGLATSGSGDVLAGLVAGVAARCGDPAQAACWGTHLHAAAGRRLGEHLAPVGYLAREIADAVPYVLADLTRRPDPST